MTLNQLQTQHFCLRAGFGEPINVIQEYTGKSKKELINLYFKTSKKNYKPLKLDGVKPINYKRYKMQSDEMKREMRQMRQQQVKDIRTKWLNLMVENGGIREKMTLFWHNHFSCEPKQPFFAQQYIDVLRKNAIGNFKEMLFEISKSPAMLNYLNNRQNVEEAPNENFAREVMELFTLGRGYYTEDDIKNAARAFTGWSFNRRGEFLMRHKKHDFKEKTFFGETGKLEGEDVLNRLLEEKQTAIFLSTKLYRFLVNDNLNEAHVTEIADVLYNSDYNIEKWLRHIFMSDWFYAEENIGCLIKSPIEYIATTQRQFNMSFGKDKPILYAQKMLGQELLEPPNVAGWKGGRTWIDNSTLVTRQNWASGAIGVNLWHQKMSKLNKKQQKNAKRAFKKLPTTIDWTAMETALNNIPDNQIENFLKGYLFQVPVKMEVSEFLEWKARGVNKAKMLIPLLMKLPEFQIC